MKVFLTRTRAKTCYDLHHARRIVLMHVLEKDLTARRFKGGRVEDEGQHIATVAYNGIVWPPGSWHPGVVPLIDARGNKPELVA